MNKTKIEWCDSTWNPVTGCKHDCPYCYARRISARYGGWTTGGKKVTANFGKVPAELKDPLLLEHSDGKVTVAPYPFGFEPTFHRYRLDEPARKTKGQTIFVCSMADLFGKWVPIKWIVEVLDACLRAPQHRYLFLTKNPERYMELEHLALLPHEDNFWFGSTVTTGSDPAAWMVNMGCHWFVSCEPLLGKIDITSGEGPMPEWVIIGAETGNRKEKVTPDYEWARQLVADCKTFGIPVFMKNSMKDIWPGGLLTEFPWEDTL